MGKGLMEGKYLQLLEEMVNIDSGTGETQGLARVAAIIQRQAVGLGYNFETLAGPDGSKHYYLSKGCGKRILLVAHIDTVFPAGTARARPFAIDGDLARGPGVSDCKSGVVTILAALEQYHCICDSAAEIGCLFNSDEEIGSPGSKDIIQRLAREAQAVFVVEPAEGETITVARKGIGRFCLEVFGKAAHSGSNFTDGHSAILEMAHKIIAVSTLTDLAAGITLNTGVIRGGTKSNVVPDYAVADIDLRIRAAGQEAEIIKQLEQIAVQSRDQGVTGKLSGGITRPPMPATPQNLRLFELFRETAAELGQKLDVCHSGGGSDANFVAAVGTPVVDGVGPVGGGHHSAEEYLNIPSMFFRIDLLAQCLKKFAES